MAIANGRMVAAMMENLIFAVDGGFWVIEEEFDYI
jgi:hypothetical protein